MPNQADPAGPDLPTPPGSSSVLAAARRMLRPLVGLLIRRGITFPLMVDLLRGLYVDVAANDLLPDPKARTDSRISLMTGVHRKEIRRQRSSQDHESGEPPIVTIATQVVARWLALARDGVLPPLPRTAPSSVSSFEQIVSEVTTDIRPRALFDEWVAQGVLRVDEADRVHLNADAFLPPPGSEEQAFFLGRNLADHVAAGSANVLATGPAPFLDRSAHYDGLSPETAQRIEARAREIASRALLEINMVALAEIEGAGDGQTAGPARVNVGMFVYRPPPGPETAA